MGTLEAWMESIGGTALGERILSTPAFYPLWRVLSMPLDIRRWDWTQLDLVHSTSFRWDYGSTPFTNWQIIVGAWVIYFGSILGLKAIMSFMPEFKLANVVAIHNVILMLWSLFMAVSIAIDIANVYLDEGMEALFCTTRVEQMRGRMFYGLYIYYLSKYYELFDTIILALKKKNIIFLHWFHHAIVILMAWSWVHYGLVYASLGMLANTVVHVFMYYYYYRAALGYDVWFKRYITSGQIVQFSVSFALSVPFVYYHMTRSCFGMEAFVFTMICNGIFLFLFIRFYKGSYKGEKKGSSNNGARGKTKKTE